MMALLVDTADETICRHLSREWGSHILPKKKVKSIFHCSWPSLIPLQYSFFTDLIINWTDFLMRSMFGPQNFSHILSIFYYHLTYTLNSLAKHPIKSTMAPSLFLDSSNSSSVLYIVLVHDILFGGHYSIYKEI